MHCCTHVKKLLIPIHVHSYIAWLSACDRHAPPPFPHPPPPVAGAPDSARSSGGPEKVSNPGGNPSPMPTSGPAATTSSSDGSSKGPKIRFWPSVRVHAVQEGMAEPPGSPSAASAGLFQKGRPSAQQQQQVVGCRPNGIQQLQSGSAVGGGAGGEMRKRASSVQVVVQQARRMSAHVASGVSAAGRAADRLRVQLVQRASAIKAMICVDEAEQETSQVGTESVAWFWRSSRRCVGDKGRTNTSTGPAQVWPEPQFWWAASCLRPAAKMLQQHARSTTSLALHAAWPAHWLS